MMHYLKTFITFSFVFGIYPASSLIADDKAMQLRTGHSTFTRVDIDVKSLVAVSHGDSDKMNPIYKQIDLVARGSIGDTEDTYEDTYVVNIVGYQLEGKVTYSLVWLTKKGSKVYAFDNKDDLIKGRNPLLIGELNENGELTVYDHLWIELKLVIFRPTLLDKIMSWILNGDGGVVSAKEYTEIKFIKKKQSYTE